MVPLLVVVKRSGGPCDADVYFFNLHMSIDQGVSVRNVCAKESELGSLPGWWSNRCRNFPVHSRSRLDVPSD